MEQVNATSLVSVRASRLYMSVLASDGRQYFVKIRASSGCFGTKALAYKITGRCGVPTVQPAVVKVDDDFARRARALCQCEEVGALITSGSYFGSRYPADPGSSTIFDYFPPALSERIQNIEDLAKMRTVDSWIANPSPGQTIFVGQGDKTYRAHAVGFGGSFSFLSRSLQRNWNWRLSSLRSPAKWLFAANMIDVVHQITKTELKSMTADIPSDWWNGSPASAVEIVEALVHRKKSLGSRLATARRRECDLPDRKPVQSEWSLSATSFRRAG